MNIETTSRQPVNQAENPLVSRQKPFVFTKKNILEAISLVASTAILAFVSHKIAVRQPLHHLVVWSTVFFSPIQQELLFRGMIQEGVIHQIQKVINRSGGPVSEESLKAQEAFRVNVTAILFGAFHAASVPSETIFGKLAEGMLYYIPGRSYGYLKERYNTLSVSILAHGLSNAFLALAYVSKQSPLLKGFCFAGYVGAQVAWYLLATHDIHLPSREQLALQASRAKQYVASFFRPSQPPAIIS